MARMTYRSRCPAKSNFKYGGEMFNSDEPPRILGPHSLIYFGILRRSFVNPGYVNYVSVSIKIGRPKFR